MLPYKPTQQMEIRWKFSFEIRVIIVVISVRQIKNKVNFCVI
jgi:hypothetical protein